MPKQAQLKKNNEDIFLNIYKIGDIYITTNSENPADRFGGTWELFGPGRCLVCVDTSQTEFNSVKKTGGSKYLQSHNHTFSANTNTTGGHTHGLGNQNSNTSNKLYAESYVTGWAGNIFTGYAGEHYHSISGTTSSNGSGDSQNLQPYITCYVWIRIA